MPVIQITLNDRDYQYLQEEYKQASSASPQPAFEQWLTSRLTSGIAERETPHEDVRAINAIEKLVIGLQPNGFALAHLAKQGAPESAAMLAESLAADLKLSQHQARRLQELFAYYLRNPKEIADLSQVVVTNRAYGALHEAYRELAERTTKSLDHLDADRALGRAEGAIAILVSMNVIERAVAKEKIQAFKMQIRNSGKPSWVGKVFGGAGEDD
ncbi:hypothetical protein [Noviherbaspirillum massiliense]|uniref:hypothetical protein n=1 Tax=Noviherbaspirillum massiliense TaxID=1465823 RepID=UPI0003104646|nr:hypothetical protein [Noviherbaspirillum massiliense]